MLWEECGLFKKTGSAINWLQKGALTRTLTGAVILAATLVFLHFSHIRWVTGAVTAALSMGAVFELLRAVHLLQERWLLAVCLGGAALLALVPFPGYTVALRVIFPLAVVIFGIIMRKAGRAVLDTPPKALALCFLTALLFRAIPELRAREDGLYLLALAMGICYVTDASAYLVGTILGRHKLCPDLSPKKTVEGAVGGLLGAFALTWLLPGRLTPAAAFYALTASAVGQFGDLAMSGVKRSCAVKDYGSLLPGHGGILDRFDRHLFTVAYTLLFAALI